jgi:squalene cyclase
MGLESLIEEVKVLNPEDGSIIVISTTATDRDAISKIMNSAEPLMEHLKDKKCFLLVFPAGVDITMLSEKAMNDLGWVRQKQTKIII